MLKGRFGKVNVYHRMSRKVLERGIRVSGEDRETRTRSTPPPPL